MKLRLHKYLSQSGVASLRKAEELIRQGKVTVNGVVAVIGQPVDPEADKVVVAGRPVAAPAPHVYYLLNKPHGVVSTTHDPEGRKTVLDFMPDRQTRLYPVGRLDYESEGLILLTNDGALAEKLTHPKYEIEKTYHVLVKGHPTAMVLKILTEGVHLEDGVTAPAAVDNLVEEGGNTWLDITIHEGRNRQIRRMCEALHYPVLRLVRTRLGPWELGDLRAGKVRTVSRPLL